MRLCFRLWLRMMSIVRNNISTPFIYCPRTCPAIPLPNLLRLSSSNRGFVESPEWGMFEDRSMTSNKVCGGQEVISKVFINRSFFNEAQLYLPASRVFCLRQPTSRLLLLHFPLLHSRHYFQHFSTKQHTEIELLRWCAVDVRNWNAVRTRELEGSIDLKKFVLMVYIVLSRFLAPFLVGGLSGQINIMIADFPTTLVSQSNCNLPIKYPC